MMRLSALILPMLGALLVPCLVLASPAAVDQPGSQPAPQPAAQPEPQPAAQPEPPAEPAPMATPLAAPSAAPGTMAQPPAVAPSTQDGRRIRQQNNRHGLGLSLGMSPGFGFAYRNYFGNTVVQASLFAAVLDRGDNATVWVGVQIARYLLVWQQARRTSLLPRTSALRLVGGGSYLYNRSKDTILADAPGCVPVSGVNCPTVETDRVNKLQMASLGAGIGFEFGAIMRPGVSFAIDLQLTALFDAGSFIQLWPLPSVALMYSW